VKAMAKRNLQEGDWMDRERWKTLGTGSHWRMLQTGWWWWRRRRRRKVAASVL
jgi:hypothetical protein